MMFAVDIDPGRPHRLGVIAYAYSPDGGKIVSASRDKTLKVWYEATGENIGNFVTEGPVNRNMVDALIEIMHQKSVEQSS